MHGNSLQHRSFDQQQQQMPEDEQSEYSCITNGIVTTATQCNTLYVQYTATCCNTPQRTAMHCNSLQHWSFDQQQQQVPEDEQFEYSLLTME